MKKSLLYRSFFMLLTAFLFSAFTPIGETIIVNDVHTYTNSFRKSKGLAPLKIDEQLNAIAQKHSENMAARKVPFGHAGFDKRNKLANTAHPSLLYFAENVAYGPTTGKDAVKLWENSAGHRKNMLGKYTLIGIGIAKAKNGSIYYTQIFGG